MENCLVEEEEIYQELKSVGLRKVADKIIPLAKKCIKFYTIPTEEKNIPIGASKLGGAPDVPEDVYWPSWEEKLLDYRGLLSFIGQLNLADLSQYCCRNILPQSGILYFFYDTQRKTWGFNPDDFGSWRVIFSNTPQENLSRRIIPEELSKFQYKPCKLSFYEAFSFPEGDSFAIDNLNLTNKELYKYFDFCEMLIGKNTYETQHQILGYSVQI